MGTKTKPVVGVFLLLPCLFFTKTSYSVRGGDSAFRERRSDRNSLRRQLDISPQNLSLNRHTDLDNTQVLRGGRAIDGRTPYVRAIGRTGGCTATLVSPPNSEVTAIVFAAHCGGGSSEFILNGQTYKGFQCYTNKDFSTSDSTNDDVGVCFSKEKINTGVYGCLSPSDKVKVGVGEPLRIFGYGHPNGSRENPLPQVETLLSGVTQVTRVQNGRAIIAQGPSVVTPGDSGGPAIRESDFQNSQGNTFGIVGINSKYLLDGLGEHSTFAPFDTQNMDFFKRATARFKTEKNSEEPQICGFNIDPKGNDLQIEDNRQTNKSTSQPPSFETPSPSPENNPPAPQNDRPRSDTTTPFTRITNTPTERTTAINGFPVPEGAIGYRIKSDSSAPNGIGVDFVFSEQPEQTPPPTSPPQAPRANHSAPFIRFNDRPNERTTAVNSMPVPQGAIGYRLSNNHQGGIEFVFPESSPNEPTPTPQAPTPTPQAPTPTPQAPTAPHSSSPSPSTQPQRPSAQVDQQVDQEERDFECVRSDGGFRPQHKEIKKPLGLSTIPTLAECERVLKASRNDVVCSATGLNENGRNYKPTFKSGISNPYPKLGYVGGSSMSLNDCLFATERSSSTHVCFWGGTQWYATSPTGDNSSKGGPFTSLQSCVASYNGTPRRATPPSASQNPPQQNTPPRQPNRPPQPPSVPPPPQRVPNTASPTATRGHELLNTNCVSCHKTGGEAKPFPTWITQQGALERRLLSSNLNEKREAQSLIRKFHEALNQNDNMPPKPEDRKALNANPEMQKFKAWIDRQHQSLSNQASPRGGSTLRERLNPKPTVRASNAVQLLPQDKLNFYQSLLPQVENPALAAILKDPNTLFFDRKSMVAGYQDPSAPVQGVRTTEKGFRGAPFGNGAQNAYLDNQGHLRTFSAGVGLTKDGDNETFHFIHLPKDANGNLQKIKVVKRRVPPDEGFTYDWEFPVGTVSGEVVFNKDGNGRPQVLEIRTRTKDNPTGAWAPDIMRPYPTAHSLRERLNEIAQSNSNLKDEAQGLLSHLNNPQRLKNLDLQRDGYQKGNFESQGGTDTLPNMSQNMVSALLKTPFKSSLGTEWDRNSQVTAFAPTTNQAGGLIPQHGGTGATRVDRESCNKCHEESNKPIRNFFNESHPLYYSSIYAYGNLPGSDRNLRFTIFDQSQFSNFGRDGVNDNRVIRRDLLPILDIQP